MDDRHFCVTLSVQKNVTTVTCLQAIAVAMERGETRRGRIREASLFRLLWGD
jgi:hypothetical protein